MCFPWPPGCPARSCLSMGTPSPQCSPTGPDTSPLKKELQPRNTRNTRKEERVGAFLQLHSSPSTFAYLASFAVILPSFLEATMGIAGKSGEFHSPHVDVRLFEARIWRRSPAGCNRPPLRKQDPLCNPLREQGQVIDATTQLGMLPPRSN